MSRRSASPYLLITCEHGGNRIPAAYARLFRGASAVLNSHRGWDPGALTLARQLAKSLRRPLLPVTVSRLFVEANRAPTNRRIWSAYTKGLPLAERKAILDRYWRPHRTLVEKTVASAIGRGNRVLHIAVHSFTPVLDGEVRNADIGLLYDSRRKRERAVCRSWGRLVRGLDRSLRVRYNYPYPGATDGLATWLRKRHPETRYVGIELEINQAHVDGGDWLRFQNTIVDSVRGLIAAT